MEKKSKCCGEEMRWVDEFLCCARCGKETTPQPAEESLRGEFKLIPQPEFMRDIKPYNEAVYNFFTSHFKHLILSHSDIPEKTLAEIIDKLK